MKANPSATLAGISCAQPRPSTANQSGTTVATAWPDRFTNATPMPSINAKKAMTVMLGVMAAVQPAQAVSYANDGAVHAAARTRNCQIRPLTFTDVRHVQTLWDVGSSDFCNDGYGLNAVLAQCLSFASGQNGRLVSGPNVVRSQVVSKNEQFDTPKIVECTFECLVEICPGSAPT